MKKRIALCLLAFLLLFTLTGCGDESTTSEKSSSSKIEKKSTKVEDSVELSKANIEETVILDEDGIKVTAKEIEYDSYGNAVIKALIENNTSQNIRVSTKDFSINGIMINPFFGAEVKAGKKSNAEIEFTADDLEYAHITTIKDIVFALEIYDADSYDDILETDLINLETDATGYTQEYNTSGELVVDQDGIKIYLLGKNEDGFIGTEIEYYIENNSKRKVTVDAEDLAVNGYMMNSTFSSTLNPGMKKYDSIIILDSELEENDITDIEEVEFIFTVYDDDTWEDIFETDTITVNF